MFHLKDLEQIHDFPPNATASHLLPKSPIHNNTTGCFVESVNKYLLIARARKQPTS